MKRLTIKKPNGAALEMNDTYPNENAAREDLMNRFRVAIDRLAAYEDAGLDPEEVELIKISFMGKSIAEIKEFDGIPIERLQELAQAEQDGRLVVPPCKVGDTVWIIERDECEEPIEISGYMFFAFVGRAVIVSAFINDSKTLDETVEYHIEETSRNYDTDLSVFPQNDCYLTREEAEAALKKSEDEK